MSINYFNGWQLFKLLPAIELLVATIFLEADLLAESFNLTKGSNQIAAQARSSQCA